MDIITKQIEYLKESVYNILIQNDIHTGIASYVLKDISKELEQKYKEYCLLHSIIENPDKEDKKEEWVESYEIKKEDGQDSSKE